MHIWDSWLSGSGPCGINSEY